MWPPCSPPYQPVIALRSRLGTPPCTRSLGSSMSAIWSGVYFEPHTAAPGIADSNASLTFA